MSDLVGNPKDMFPRDAAQKIKDNVSVDLPHNLPFGIHNRTVNITVVLKDIYSKFYWWHDTDSLFLKKPVMIWHLK